MLLKQNRIRETVPFHWSSSTLPELACLKPIDDDASFLWSGSFDPLLIGTTPIRTRHEGKEDPTTIRSVRVDVDIRPGTGKTGINISLREEASNGNGAIYRIENSSPFPIWAVQDNVPVRDVACSDLVPPHSNISFSLDQPLALHSKRGKKTPDMLDTRLSLAPLESNAGRETSQVISLASEGKTVVLSPSQLTFLGSELRGNLQGLVVAGTTRNDGPTRVLVLR